MTSFIDCFEEMDTMVGIVTETWLTDGDSLEHDIVDLAAGTGIGLICRNGPPNQRGVLHGGVAIAYRESACKMQKIEILNPDDYEILVTLATIPVYVRKIITVTCYIPPNYSTARGQGCLNYIEDVILDMKRKYRDPFIMIGGDFN